MRRQAKISAVGPEIARSTALGRSGQFAPALIGALCVVLLFSVGAKADQGDLVVNPDVVIPTYDSSFDLSGMPAGQAANFSPQNLAVDQSGGPSNGDVYVLDEGNDAVDKFSATGTYLSQLKQPEGSFSFSGISNEDIAVDNSNGPGAGNVYVVTEGTEKVFAFDSAGAFLWQLDLGAVGQDILGVAVDSTGHPWVADYNSDVKQYALDVDPHTPPTATGIAVNNQSTPDHLAFDAADDMFVDSWPGGAPLRVSSTVGVPDVTFNGPGGNDIAVNSFYGDVYATGDNAGVMVWDNEGTSWTQVQVSANVFGPATSFGPGQAAGIAVNGNTGKDYISHGNAVDIYNGQPPQYKLNATADGFGSGSVSADSGTISGCTSSGGVCSGFYDPDTVVTLTASPDEGSSFTGWSGDCSGTALTCQVTVDQARDVTATFAPSHSLTVDKTGAGSGSVSCDGGTCASTYGEGAEVTLTASPDSGSTFTGWSGGDCTGTGDCVVTISADTTITADFGLADTDGDGVPDNSDACPAEAAATANGCPVVVTPPPPSCATDASLCPKPPVKKKKTLKCKKGFKKTTKHGKQVCVKVKKHKKHKKH